MCSDSCCGNIFSVAVISSPVICYTIVFVWYFYLHSVFIRFETHPTLGRNAVHALGLDNGPIEGFNVVTETTVLSNVRHKKGCFLFLIPIFPLLAIFSTNCFIFLLNFTHATNYLVIFLIKCAWATLISHFHLPRYIYNHVVVAERFPARNDSIK